MSGHILPFWQTKVGGEEIKGLFKSSDLKVQGKRLVDMLTMSVFMLNDLTHLKPKLEDLALRHINYGVKKEHYQYVATALIATLELCLGDDWKNDKELQETWLAVWGFISASMTTIAYLDK
jgi:hemoglobin-like flavoprotein